MKGLFAKDANSRSVMVGVLIILLLAGLPLAVWLDLTSLAEARARPVISTRWSAACAAITPAMSSAGFVAG